MNAAQIKILDDYTKSKKSLYVNQIDIKTNKIVRIFKNRYQAAKWLLNNELVMSKITSRGIGFTRASVTGALTLAIRSGNSFGGFKWEVSNDEENIEQSPSELIEIRKPSGRLIKRAASVEHASKITKIDSSLIRRNILKKTKFAVSSKFGNVVFDSKDTLKSKITNLIPTPKRVQVFNDEMEPVGAYDSIGKASKELGVSRKAITDVLNGVRPITKGFVFKEIKKRARFNPVSDTWEEIVE